MKNLWKKDKYLSNIDVNDYEILSLDVFDTLVFRMVNNPEDLFLELGKNALQKGYLKKILNAFEFAQLRKLAQNEAKTIKRKKSNIGEIDIHEIYELLPHNIGDKENILDLEILMEKKICLLNRSIESLILNFKEKGKKVVLLSDMYLGKKYIIEILEYIGLDVSLIDDILVSSDYGVGKSTGSLFKELMKRICRETSWFDEAKILHIGDNKAADVDGANALNIKAIYYGVKHNEKEDLFYLENIMYGTLAPEIINLRKLATTFTANMTNEEKTFFEVGAGILGPIFSLFSDWIVDIAVSEQKNRIYTLMREGMIFSKLISNSALFNNENIEIKPIFVSRASTVTPSIERLDKVEIEKLMDRRNISVEDVFNILGINKFRDCFKKYLTIKIKDSNNIIVDRDLTLRDMLLKYLLELDINKEAMKTIEDKRKKLVGYLKKELDDDFKDAITVDFGYQGTIQTSIEKVLKICGLEHNFTHLLTISREITKYKVFNGMDIRGFLSNCGEYEDLVNRICASCEPIEQLILGEYGTTLGYERIGEGEFVPVLDNNLIPDKEIRNKLICEQGILIFQKLWLDLLNTKPELKKRVIDIYREDLLQILTRLVEFPTYDEAYYIGNLHHDDTYGTSCMSVICEKECHLSEDEIFNIKRYGYGYSGLRWPQAMIVRKNRKYLLKKYMERNDKLIHLNLIKKIVWDLKRDNITNITIYGAGIAGQQFLYLFDLYGIKVDYFIDRKKSLWGSQIEGIEVISLEQAKQKRIKNFVIGSFAYVKDIQMNISKNIISPNIFSA